MGSDKLFLYGIVFVVALAAIGFAYFSLAGNGHTEAKYQSAVAAENTADVCATPLGYTDEQWREHMGHHPDKYKQCLGGINGN